MTQNCTMKLTKYLICFVLLVVYAQSIEAKHSKRHRKSTEEQLCRNYVLAKPERDLRGIRDVWAKIRGSAIKSWNYIKSVAEKTKDKINKYMENVKEHANELKKQFEKKLEELKDKFNNIISDLYGTGELVKQCVQNDQEKLEEILKEIMVQMGECIAEEINQLTKLNSNKSLPAMNETKFIKELDDKIGLCERDMENAQECLCRVREDIFDKFTGMENDILENHFEARNIADDVKETLVTCSINNIIDVSNLISAEIVEIAKCVVEGKGNEAESSTNNNEIS